MKKDSLFLALLFAYALSVRADCHDSLHHIETPHDTLPKRPMESVAGKLRQRRDTNALLCYVAGNEKWTILMSGNVSSSLPLQGAIRLEYILPSKVPMALWGDVQVGRVYNAAALGWTCEPGRRWILNTEVVAHQFTYYEDDRFFYFDAPMTHFRQREYYLRCVAEHPLWQHATMAFSAAGAFRHDAYHQNTEELLEANRFDHSRYWMIHPSFRISGNTLDNPYYPTRGVRWHVGVELPLSTERTRSENYPDTDVSKGLRWWIQGKAHWEGYWSMNTHFSLGSEAEGVWSSRNMLSNYTATVIAAPHYAPTLHSRMEYNSTFSALQYVAGGLKPIACITPRWQVRMEGYAFVPVFAIKCAEDNTAYYSKFLSSLCLLAEVATVYTFDMGCASLYANWYSTPANNWNIGVNIGILMFHDKILD